MTRKTLISCLIMSSLSLAACSQDAAKPADAADQDKPETNAQSVTTDTSAVTLNTDEQKEGYAMGMALGQQITSQIDQVPVKFDRDMLVRALSDAIHGKDFAMNTEEMTTALTSQRDRVTAITEEKAKSAKTDGDKFLAEFAKQDGVQKTESGIYYIVTQAGDGEQPKPTDSVKVHYRGTLKDGTEFDSSYSRNQPAEFPVGGVIKGWQEILPLMKTGGKWKVAIPSDLAYGERGAGGSIGPNEPLVFEIELLEIK